MVISPFAGAHNVGPRNAHRAVKKAWVADLLQAVSFIVGSESSSALSTLDIVFAIVFLILGVLFSAYLVADMTVLVRNYNMLESEHKEKMDNINDWMRALVGI